MQENQPTSQRETIFTNEVIARFELYNSLFLTLPFYKIKDNKITIKGGSKSAKATILVYPRKVGTNEYIQLICRPQNGKSETTKMSIRLVKK